MRTATVYTVTITGAYKVEASNEAEAVEKAQKWAKNNPTQLNYAWSVSTVEVKGTGDP